MRTGQGSAIAGKLGGLARPLLSREGIVRADTFVVGAAGAGREAERAELEQALTAERLAWKVLVTTDAELARAAAFGGGPGVLLIAGTGSIAIGVDTDGVSTRVGGLGWRISDQGSAHWLGARALEAVGAMHDRIGPVTHLAETLVAAVGVQGIAGLVRWSTAATTAQVAALGPVVVSTADQGDAVATGIVDLGVELLGRLATAAGAGPLPVALSGGLISAGRPLRERLMRQLVERQHVSVLEGPVDPCTGGPVLAERLIRR
jgi:glucosamine kinase